MLIQLAQDQEVNVLCAVARNPQTPFEGVQCLAQTAENALEAYLCTNTKNEAKRSQWGLLRRMLIEGFTHRSVEQLYEVAAKATPALAQLLVEAHKREPLPESVLQAGLKGPQAEIFRQLVNGMAPSFIV